MTHHAYLLERFAKIYPFSHCVWRIPEAAAELELLSLNGPCLDLGCGDGTYMQILLERAGRPRDPVTGTFSKFIGLDKNASEVAKAQKSGVYDETYVSSSNQMPLPDQTVRLVFSNSVVEHIEDKEGTLREVARVLQPGGAYLFSAPTPDFETNLRLRRVLDHTHLSRLGEAWVEVINRKFRHHWIQSLEQWRSDLSRHGLGVIKWRYTLTPGNLATWERYLIPSYLQHIPAKRWGWVPGADWTRRALEKRLTDLLEPADLARGGNIVILAEKSV